MTLLLGIDPGLAATGWGLLDEAGRTAGCGTVRTAPGPPGPRLLQLVTELRGVLTAHRVGEAALEELFMGRNTTSAIGVAQARGAILVTLTAAGIPVFEYKPAQVKASLTGYGMADKAQMARMLAQQVRSGGRLDEHAADALAVALCHARSRRLRAITDPPHGIRTLRPHPGESAPLHRDSAGTPGPRFHGRSGEPRR